ncbi:MAG: N-formylglutamate amidohydrolase [Alphaproteobacteria bacterium]|jgi:predicted N-formylglutamate amidohydrolase
MELLAADEPPPFHVERARGASPYLLVCEHASKRLPRKLGTLGLSTIGLERHIAWDIGAAAVARDLSARLDATLISQTYSRLVIDCNRLLEAHDAIPTISEETEIPGNQDLSQDEIDARIREIHQPYQACISDHLDAREAPILFDIHSFTPVFKGQARPWHIGLLYGEAQRRLADILFGLIAKEDRIVVGDNQPYAVEFDNDYTIPVHGVGRGIVNLEIETRQDLITSEAGQEEWATRLEGWLTAAQAQLT